MTDQTEVRNAENVRKRHFVVNKKMFSVCTPADRIFSVCIFWPGMRLDCSILSF